MLPIRLLGVPLVVALVLVGPTGVRQAVAQDRTARGTVTTVTDVSLTVKAGDKDMTFDIDSKTLVHAVGAGRQTRAAQAAGAAGIKLTGVIQSGEPVLVTYHEANGKNLATNISRVSTAGSGGGSVSEAIKIVTGTVKSVTASALVVTSDGKDSTFAIDRETMVQGRGAGTSAAAAGGRIAIASLVRARDTVSVSYKEIAGVIHATEIRITAKAR
jgi:hypothetical protein